MFNKNSRPFPWKICLQTTFNQSDPAFADLLKIMKECGYFGIELNIPELGAVCPAELQKLLDRHGLVMTMLATGAYAKKNGLSLSSTDEFQRAASVEGCKQNIMYARQMGCGIIVGFMKGGKNDVSAAALKKSLQELLPLAQQYGVPFLLEATNRAESALINTVESGFDIVSEHDFPVLGILPDTYHMNIEEGDIADALNKFGRKIPNIHFSDNNRAFPGLGGTLDFLPILKTLDKIGYAGPIAFEGNVQTSLSEDAAAAVSFIRDRYSALFSPVR